MKTDKITIGILAHVDAGKTTLSESILYLTGRIKKQGRVDHKDAFLDTYDLEKSRGITIFSKQAMFPLGDYNITLLDTPGHVDFSAEMERTLRVLDYAVLVINGTDGVQGHTLTVWKLLEQYNVATFIFVNKMDLLGVDKEKIVNELQTRISENCVGFNIETEQMWDEIAVCDESLMETYLEHGILETEDIQKAVGRRRVFPVYFGSALKNEGVEEFLKGIAQYIKTKSYPDIFGARVFKVTRNQQGERLTYLKITGGNLKVKSLLSNQHKKEVEGKGQDNLGIWEEKVDQIRLYSGANYEMVNQVEAGTICAVTGLTKTIPGDGLGFENKGNKPFLIPVLSYRVLLQEDVNVYTMIKNLQLLEEEDPHLNVVWNEKLSEIHVQVMGEIQIEILKSTIKERFGVAVEFDKGSLVYRETIAETVIGMGHFEPLKHYAEVHLLLEPLEIGEGIVFTADCSEDMLGKNWQRLVLSHLYERQHIGVLTGSVLTDMKVTLIAGRAHNKHTEGGDFRQATFRALRQGLMQAESVLLEPVYEFSIELPKEMLGKAMSDVEKMHGRYSDPLIEGEQAIIKGIAPVVTMMHYATEVAAYTKGQGRLSLSLKGYEPCHNAEEVIESIAYNPSEDVDCPAGSVFCSKGSGYTVAWENVKEYMHVESRIKLGADLEQRKCEGELEVPQRRSVSESCDDEELEAIFTQTYGTKKERTPGGKGNIFNKSKSTQSSNSGYNKHKSKSVEEKERYLLVDGYNMIFSWDNLKKLAEEYMDTARLRLMDMLCNYQAQRGETVILVFDAYRVAGNRGEAYKYNNIYVVYTKEAETADQYIEKLVHTIRPAYEVTVATSDVLEQIIILGKGATRLSAEGLKAEMDYIDKNLIANYNRDEKGGKNRPIGDILEKYEK